MTDRQRERLLHLERELQNHQRGAAKIQQIPPTSRSTEQLEMLRHHLLLQKVVRRMIAELPSTHQESTMTLFRVEAHDGKGWGFGIITPGGSVPQFCSLHRADTGTRAEMEALKLKASRLVGGTLRVAEVPADA